MKILIPQTTIPFLHGRFFLRKFTIHLFHVEQDLKTQLFLEILTATLGRCHKQLLLSREFIIYMYIFQSLVEKSFSSHAWMLSVDGNRSFKLTKLTLIFLNIDNGINKILSKINLQ